MKLDEATLREVNRRLDVLEPYVQEHKELVKRRVALETRLGKDTRVDRIRRLLAAHPRGLSRSVIGDELDLVKSNSLSGALGELKRQGHVETLDKGIYRLTDLGHEAVSARVAA